MPLKKPMMASMMMRWRRFAAVKHAGFCQLGQMREAAIVADKGETDNAVAAYDAIIAGWQGYGPCAG